MMPFQQYQASGRRVLGAGCLGTGDRSSVSGQAMIFVVLVLVILVFVVLWNFDLHKTLYVKTLSRDGADSAALAAARWQGVTLNLIGELNVMQAALITEGLVRGDTEFPEAQALDELRNRLSFVGPAMGLVAANQAAKNNAIYNNPSYSNELFDHVARVRTDYPRQFDPPWGSVDGANLAWHEYATMLETIAAHGIAAMPDNASWYVDYADWNHPLLNPAFYDAVASLNWCWFFLHNRALLDQYTVWRNWPALPAVMQREPINSEVFSLRLSRIRTAANLPVLDPGHPQGETDEWAEQVTAMAAQPVHADVALVDVAWHIYNPSDWYDWTELVAPDFPFETPIREVYNVVGADAAVRLSAEASRLTPGMGESLIRRTSAAKPFGMLPDDQRIDAFGMVLPGFTDVRLIPMDASTAPEGGSQPGWVEHVYEHLPIYMETGPAALSSGCYYCRQLIRWEDAEFRQRGQEWLEENSQLCEQTGGPGPGPGGRGGTRRGH